MSGDWFERNHDEREENMEFGYFTLSDNHYAGNSRKPNQFVTDIIKLRYFYAEQIGMHSAIWIGEHHFNPLEVPSMPRISCLPTLREGTKRIRLAPAVTVLPLHHPIRVAEQWATLDFLEQRSRGLCLWSRLRPPRIAEPFRVSFDDNQGVFEEGLEVLRKLWEAEGRLSHHGKHYSFNDVRITLKAASAPDPRLCRLFLETFDRVAAARLGCG